VEQRPRVYRSTVEYALTGSGLIYDEISCRRWKSAVLSFYLHRYDAADCHWSCHLELDSESIDSISLSVRPF
jgi:hypothetical protein